MRLLVLTLLTSCALAHEAPARFYVGTVEHVEPYPEPIGAIRLRTIEGAQELLPTCLLGFDCCLDLVSDGGELRLEEPRVCHGYESAGESWALRLEPQRCGHVDPETLVIDLCGDFVRDPPGAHHPLCYRFMGRARP